MNDYGTSEYLEYYEENMSDRIYLLKISTGEMIMGYVTAYENHYSIDFPLEVIRVEGYASFFMQEYTPELEYRTISIKKQFVMAEPMVCSDANVMSYRDSMRRLYEGEEGFDVNRHGGDESVLH